MSEKEYMACDEEVFAMVNGNRRNRPVAVLMPMEQALRVEEYERRMAAEEIRRHQQAQILQVAVPACIGVLAVGAMARDMMSPGLAIFTLGACILWGAVKAWRAFYGKTQNAR